jgi:hypothetical protein
MEIQKPIMIASISSKTETLCQTTTSNITSTSPITARVESRTEIISNQSMTEKFGLGNA